MEKVLLACCSLLLGSCWGLGRGVGVESVLMENEIFRTVIGSFHANLIRGPQVTHSEFAETLHICSNK